MPGENVSFEAFGQYHMDENALSAVFDRLKALHTALQKEGKQLVIGIERSDRELKDSESLKELHNEGLVQAYCDDARKHDREPTYDDFKAKHEGQLQWGSNSMPLESADQLARVERRSFGAKREASLQTFFEKQLAGSKSDTNAGKGLAKLEEAAILQWAEQNKVAVKGLDPLSDFEKTRRLTAVEPETTFDMGGMDVTVVTGGGRIDNRGLADMEHERILGMANNAASVMKDLEGSGGGCLVAVNMGSAHLGSLEVALQDELQKQGLEQAKVQMCVMVPTGSLKAELGDTPEMKADELMRLSVKDLRGMHTRLEQSVKNREKDLEVAKLVVKELEETIGRVKTLPEDEQELRQLMKDSPKEVADRLSEGVTTEDAGVFSKSTISKISEKLERGELTDAHAALTDKVQKIITAINEDSILEHEQNLEDAREALRKDPSVPAQDFARRVEDRLKDKPGEIFKTLSPDQSGKYDLSKLDQLHVEHTKTVREELGRSVACSSSSVHEDLSEDGAKVSTRSQLNLGSTPKTQITSGLKV